MDTYHQDNEMAYIMYLRINSIRRTLKTLKPTDRNYEELKARLENSLFRSEAAYYSFLSSLPQP